MYVLLGQLFALLTAVCWAQNSIVYSYLGKKAGSDAVTHVRLWLALPIMVLVNLIFTGDFIPSNITGTALMYITASGFFGFFAADLFLVRAFVEIGARNTLVVMTTSPIFSLLLSGIFYGQIPSLLQAAGILIILGGIIWVIITEDGETGQGKGIKLKGFIYAMLGSIGQAVGLILSKRAVIDDVHPVSINLIRIAAGLAGLFIYSLIRGKVTTDFKFLKNRKYLLLMLFAVIVGPVVGVILSLYAIDWAPVGIAATLMQVGPILLLPIDIFILKKKVSIGAILGTFLAVAGAVMLFVFK